MPRMCASPSPRTLSQTPCRNSIRSRHAFFKGRRANAEFLTVGIAYFLLHLADERFVFLQEPAVLGTDKFADFLQVVAHIVEDALETLLVFQLSVELLIHLVGIGDRRDRFVRAGVRHPRPRIGAVGDAYAKLQRAEAGPRGLVLLEEILDLLVD